MTYLFRFEVASFGRPFQCTVLLLTCKRLRPLDKNEQARKELDEAQQLEQGGA